MLSLIFVGNSDGSFLECTRECCRGREDQIEGLKEDHNRLADGASGRPWPLLASVCVSIVELWRR
jgi:hypothetical protein